MCRNLSCSYNELFEYVPAQVVPLLMKAIGWQGGSVLALETLKRVVVAGNRARDALVAQGLK
jgi:DnaJ family protein C protein 13